MAGQCKAISKSTGKRCKNKARSNRSTRCAKHARSSKPSVSAQTNNPPPKLLAPATPTQGAPSRVTSPPATTLDELVEIFEEINERSLYELVTTPGENLHEDLQKLAKSWLQQKQKIESLDQKMAMCLQIKKQKQYRIQEQAAEILKLKSTIERYKQQCGPLTLLAPQTPPPPKKRSRSFLTSRGS